MGHTRWLRMAVRQKEHAHPHRVGKIVVIHNGIIENYLVPP
jgi:glucosamine--fructose-6-phosphate aminotransferase (isomerizing)